MSRAQRLRAGSGERGVRFVVYTSALNGDDSVLSIIDRLIDRLADEVHRVDIPDADLLQESAWYP